MPAFNPDQYLAEKTGAPQAAAGFDPNKYLAEKTGAPPEEPKGILDKVGDAYDWASQKEQDLIDATKGHASAGPMGLVGGYQAAKKEFDKYTTNPLRAAIGAAQDHKGILGTLEAAKNQFGSDEPAPTGDELSERALKNTGAGPNSKKALGFLLNQATDPTSYAGGLLGEKLDTESANEPPTGTPPGQETGGPPGPAKPVNNLPEWDTVQRVKQNLTDLDNKILPEQEAMYRDKQTRDIVKAYREMQGPGPEQLSQHELAQKVEAIQKIGDTVNSISDDVHPDETARGEHVLDKITSARDRNRAMAAPLFDQLKSMQVDPVEHGNDLIDRVAKATGLKKYVISSPADDLPGAEGVAKLAPYSRKMGISPGVHKTINEVVDTINKEPLNIQELQAIREGVRSEINPQTMSNSDMAKLNQLRKGILDHIQAVAQDQAPGLDVKQLFTDYAKNETAQEEFEKMMGGKLDDKYQLTKNVPPEKVMDKIFANTNNVKVSKNYLGDDFNSIKANYLESLIDKSSPKDIFSAQKLSTLLDKNSASLQEAFKDSPESLQRVKDLADFIRLIPDASPINPPQTAKAANIYQTLSKAGGLLKEPWKIPGAALESYSNGAEDRGLLKSVDKIKAGLKP